MKLTNIKLYEDPFSASAIVICKQTSQSYLCNFYYKREINIKPTCSQSETRVRSPSLLKSLLLGRHVDYDYAVTIRTSGCPH